MPEGKKITQHILVIYPINVRSLPSNTLRHSEIPTHNKNKHLLAV